MKSRVSILFALSVLLALPSQSQSVTGIAMLPACKALLIKAEILMFGQGACLGTVATQMFNASSAGAGTTDSCPPENATAVEGVRVTVAFLEANSQRLNEHFNWLVVDALKKAWPCKK